MPRFKITGKVETISKEELRAILQASATVLEFHGGAFPLVVKVQLKKAGTMGKCKDGSNAAGSAWKKEGRMAIRNDYDTDDTMTIALHELIHITLDPGSELATSTLTAKLKPTVCRVYNALIDGVYKRAAYVAHTKIAYKPITKTFDRYNDEQYDPAHPTFKGEIYRRP